jgi:hypothetical protein
VGLWRFWPVRWRPPPPTTLATMTKLVAAVT